jgi:hypothetical protein
LVIIVFSLSGSRVIFSGPTCGALLFKAARLGSFPKLADDESSFYRQKSVFEERLPRSNSFKDLNKSSKAKIQKKYHFHSHQDLSLIEKKDPSLAALNSNAPHVGPEKMTRLPEREKTMMTNFNLPALNDVGNVSNLLLKVTFVLVLLLLALTFLAISSLYLLLATLSEGADRISGKETEVTAPSLISSLPVSFPTSLRAGKLKLVIIVFSLNLKTEMTELGGDKETYKNTRPPIIQTGEGCLYKEMSKEFSKSKQEGLNGVKTINLDQFAVDAYKLNPNRRFTFAQLQNVQHNRILDEINEDAMRRRADKEHWLRM